MEHIRLTKLELSYNVNHSTIYEWRYKFDKYGVDGLKESTTWKTYSKEFKLSAVQDYLSGKYSIREITRKYEISSTSVFRQWIKKYNGHRELKDTAKGEQTL